MREASLLYGYGCVGSDVLTDGRLCRKEDTCMAEADPVFLLRWQPENPPPSASC